MPPKGTLNDPAHGKKNRGRECVFGAELREEEKGRVDRGVHEAEEWEEARIEDEPAVLTVISREGTEGFLVR